MKLQQSHRAGGPTTPTPADLSVGFLQRGMVRYKPCSGGNRRMCISDKNPHDLLSLVLRLIRDLDDRQSEDPSGILRSCAGWIPLCRSIAVQERPERYKRLACASPAALHGGDVGENVHSRCRSLICMQCTLHTHNLVRSGSLCAAIHIDGLACWPARGACSLRPTKHLYLAFSSRCTNTKFDICCVTWCRLAGTRSFIVTLHG